jgi:hypothetical protein
MMSFELLEQSTASLLLMFCTDLLFILESGGGGGGGGGGGLRSCYLGRLESRLGVQAPPDFTFKHRAT